MKEPTGSVRILHLFCVPHSGYNVSSNNRISRMYYNDISSDHDLDITVIDGYILIHPLDYLFAVEYFD